jgi:phosphatidylglycerophosphatase C
MPTLHLFDFDGTLTYKDSSKHFYSLISSPLQYFFCYYVVPVSSIIKYFIFRGDNFNIKKQRLRAFVKFCSNSKWEYYLANSDKYIDLILRKGAIKILKGIKKNEDNHIIIVSAGISIFIDKWAIRENIGLISNEVEIIRMSNYSDIKFKDDFDCDKIGKVLKIRMKVKLSEYERIIAYGDTPNDFHMFNLANNFFYKTIT